MKKLLPALLAIVMAASMSVSTFAYQYGFESGADTLPDFGKSTGSDDPVPPDPMNRNIRRNKDAADLPPPYFYGSGDIPTDTGSPYHDNLPGGTVSNGGGSGMSTSSAGSAGIGMNMLNAGITGPGTSVLSVGNAGAGGTMSFDGSGVVVSGSASLGISQPDGLLASTSLLEGTAYNTEPKYYDDGSIGTLYIERLDKTVTVYEGESADNLKKGAGHFTETSAWDGSCVLAGHNRGPSAHFSFVKDLDKGDKIVYTTLYGTRTYEVYGKTAIGDTDHSALGWSADNLLSLVTCVAGEPSQRILVQAKEVKKV